MDTQNEQNDAQEVQKNEMDAAGFKEPNAAPSVENAMAEVSDAVHAVGQASSQESSAKELLAFINRIYPLVSAKLNTPETIDQFFRTAELISCPPYHMVPVLEEIMSLPKIIVKNLPFIKGKSCVFVDAVAQDASVLYKLVSKGLPLLNIMLPCLEQIVSRHSKTGGPERYYFVYSEMSQENAHEVQNNEFGEAGPKETNAVSGVECRFSDVYTVEQAPSQESEKKLPVYINELAPLVSAKLNTPEKIDQFFRIADLFKNSPYHTALFFERIMKKNKVFGQNLPIKGKSHIFMSTGADSYVVLSKLQSAGLTLLNLLLPGLEQIVINQTRYEGISGVYFVFNEVCDAAHAAGQAPSQESEKKLPADINERAPLVCAKLNTPGEIDLFFRTAELIKCSPLNMALALEEIISQPKVFSHRNDHEPGSLFIFVQTLFCQAMCDVLLRVTESEEFEVRALLNLLLPGLETVTYRPPGMYGIGIDFYFIF